MGKAQKAKKGKAGSKGKKGKHGGKGKKGSKESSPQKKSHSGSRKGSFSSSPHNTKSSEPTSPSKSAGGSTPSHTEASVTPSEGLFKPVHRPPLPELVLPADLDLSLPRRPSTIYFWDWGDVWFFPASVMVLAIVVLGMIVMSRSIQYADFEALHETTPSGNATSVTLSHPTTAPSEIPFEHTTRWINASRPHIMEQTDVPTAPALSSNDWVRTSAVTQPTSLTEGAPVGTEMPSATLSHAGNETENVATVSSGEVATNPTWLNAPIVYPLNSSNLSFLLDASTVVDDEELMLLNASSV
ncbi:hypothetical protein MRX96_026167 [Rhipicephalus microplus]